MDVRALIRSKLEGGDLSAEEVRFLVDGAAEGAIEDVQTAAILAAIYLRGLNRRELFDWTRAMLESGRQLSFPELPQAKADKHSTGGVGDKVSIPLAPAVAACGVCVPMLSGRGLGHTGGTLDKLESIPGFRTELSEEEIHRALDRTGVAFLAQTRDLVPADRKLYALRDATGLIDSIPLIASSILSKKLAEGIGALVLDVKFGSGAFLPDPERGRELARAMLELAEGFGLRASAFLTAMDRPLGRCVGHALEIAESIECLAGGGPKDLRELVLLFGGEMLFLARAAGSTEEGSKKIADAIDSGRALGVFELVIVEQGGDPRCLKDRSRLPHTEAVEPFQAHRDGVLTFADCRKVGLAAALLGGGRTGSRDRIDPAVGIVWRRIAGEVVREGEVLAEIHHRPGVRLAEARELLSQAVSIGPPSARSTLGPLVLGRAEAR